MSIEINWDALTTGPDGLALAETIREFIHDKFQQITLPRFIRSVQVHSFDFGLSPPDIQLKDICDPLPDFYEENDEVEDDVDDEDDEEAIRKPNVENSDRRPLRDGSHMESSATVDVERSWSRSEPPSYIDTRLPGLRPTLGLADQLGSPLSRVHTPGIPGGTSNMSYFHLPLGSSLSGTQTPLAAVAGAHFPSGWQDHVPPSRHGEAVDSPYHQHSTSDSSSPPSTANSASKIFSHTSHQQNKMSTLGPNHTTDRSLDSAEAHPRELSNSPPPPRLREKRADDFQVVSRVRYAGDVKLSLTAEILLDYPMPSFVGIPLKLNITGLSFDGVAVTAYIRKRAHFCFLSPDDADALVGADDYDPTSLTQVGRQESAQASRPKVGGLLQEIKVESEIGQKENGKQVLKNVGKVERFVLEQVRRIFEDEFVYPSSWTFLV
ncbi:MAG: Mitochondrial distribution and morphology protein 12 [Pycnora praestabilis]|nr:MAG: Mitochondrial distribution and morphology protein 12 [Pycnora praestabilis]